MAFNGSNVVHIARDAKNIVYGDQINVNRLNTDRISSDAALQLLAHKTAPNACYDSERRFPPPNCHPGTRTRILEELSKWIEDESMPRAARFFWIYGSAGVGKSAIAQNLVEKYAGKRVAAAYFFSRNDSSRDKLEPFVASIAYQFCTPGSRLRSVLAPAITEAIRSDPNLFHKSCENQFQKLIIESCAKVEVSELNDLPNTIVIDGLDECVDRPSQERLLRIVQMVTAAHRFPVPWIFLIFSRPEPQIRDAFNDFGAILRRLDVSSSDEAYRDIHTYFIDHFAALRRKHHRALRYEDESWPSDNTVYQLAKRADKQFIFAATVIKYIDTDDELPQDRLGTILRIYVERESGSPYSDLDLLYHQVLSTCRRWEKVQAVLRLLVTPPDKPSYVQYSDNISWRSSEMVALLLNLRKGEVETILSRLHSVLQIPESGGRDNIRIAHASFTEFLSDANRSGEYHTPKMSHSEYFDCVAVLLLRTLSTPKQHYPPRQSEPDLTKTLSVWKDMVQKTWGDLMNYSFSNWYRYCKVVQSPSLDLLAAIGEFDPYLFMAAYAFHGIIMNLDIWRDIFVWAKSFGTSTQSFVETWEAFCQGFYAAFPPEVSPQEALWWSFDLDHLWDFGYRNSYSRQFLRKLYSLDEETGHLPRAHGSFLILPADNYPTLPDNWIITHVSVKSGGVFDRASKTFLGYENRVESLLDDILEDTCETVLQNWIKENDLTWLKSLLKERAEIFGTPLQFRPVGANRSKNKSLRGFTTSQLLSFTKNLKLNHEPSIGTRRMHWLGKWWRRGTGKK